MQCYLINAYVTDKAITPIRALGQLKFQRSSLPTGVHDKGLKIFSAHKQLARAKGKKPQTHNSQNADFRFASIYESKRESLAARRRRVCPREPVEAPRPLRLFTPLFPPSAAVPRQG